MEDERDPPTYYTSGGIPVYVIEKIFTNRTDRTVLRNQSLVKRRVTWEEFTPYYSNGKLQFFTSCKYYS